MVSIWLNPLLTSSDIVSICQAQASIQTDALCEPAQTLFTQHRLPAGQIKWTSLPVILCLSDSPGVQNIQFLKGPIFICSERVFRGFVMGFLGESEGVQSWPGGYFGCYWFGWVPKYIYIQNVTMAVLHAGPMQDLLHVETQLSSMIAHKMS